MIQPDGLWDTVSGADLQRELRSRKTPYVFETIDRSKKDSFESDGWQVVKVNKKSLRIRKPKPTGDALEDQIWTLMAQVGFEEISHGRFFKLPTGQASPPKQVDVYVKDELSALIISCKENSTWAKRSMQAELESLHGHSSHWRSSIRAKYGTTPPHFVGIAVATKNVEWSTEDEKRAEDWGIKIIRDEEIDYYTKLVQLIGTAARYQIMGDLFSGQVIPRLRNRKVAAVRGRFKNTNYYQFIIDAETLATIAYVQHRAKLSRDGEMTYQRLVSESKVRSIAEYINSDMVFPTNIVVNIQQPRGLQFEIASMEQQSDDGLSFGRLILPDSFKSAWLIDGQHRLYSYFHKNAELNLKTRKQLPVIAFENLDRKTEADLFVDINSKQTKVKRNLLLEIKSDVDIDSPNPPNQLDAICTRIALRLNSERRSPLYNRVNSEQSTSSDIDVSVTLAQFVDALKRSGLVGTANRQSRKLLPGAFYEKDPQSTVVRSINILIPYFQLLSEGAKEHWNLGNKANTSRAIGGHLNSSRGVGSLILLLSSVVEFITATFDEDFSTMTPNKFVATVEAYIPPVINYFRNPSFEDIRTFKRVTSGSGAAASGMREMQRIIRAQDASFSPKGLEEYLENERLALVTTVTNLSSEIMLGLTDIVIGFLKQKYPNGEDWFFTGLPLPVKTKTMEVQHNNPSLPLSECFNMPTDAKLIIQSYGQELQGKLKVGDLKWLDELIEIRNAISHQRPADPEWIDYLQDKIMPIVTNGKLSLGL